MADISKELMDARDGLENRIRIEIKNLKAHLNSINEDDNAEEAFVKILHTAEGLKKLVDVCTFIECWNENGEPPQLNK